MASKSKVIPLAFYKKMQITGKKVDPAMVTR